MIVRPPSAQDSQAQRLVKAVRKQHNWTQAELAAELGTSRQIIAKWESGAGEPNTRDLPLLRALALGMDETVVGHLMTVAQIERDVRAGRVTAAQAEALRVTLAQCLRAITRMER